MPPQQTTKENQQRKADDQLPFGLPWLDSCYQETLLPTGPWHEVKKKICDGLAENVQKQLEHKDRKQMIFELVGDEFVNKYFPQEEYDPRILLPPVMSAESKKRLHLDAQNWLQNTLTKVASDVGCQRMHVARETGEEPSPEMLDFFQHTKMVFTSGMDRHLYLQENEIIKQWKNLEHAKKQAKEKKVEEKERMKLWKEQQRLRGNIKGILKYNEDTPAPNITRVSTAASSERPITANVKGALHRMTDDPPKFWGMQSNSMGRSLICILKRDPRRFNEIAARLRGRQLPEALRQYIWMDVLLKDERSKMQDVNVEKLVRERFGKAVYRGVNELKIKRATHSPISGLIDNAVIEMYHKTPGMVMYENDKVHMTEAAKALNVLYVYDRSYEPYLIFWLFPLQLTFSTASGESEHVYELAMYLDLLNKACFPKWPEIFKVAENVMETLQKTDPELHDHLKAVAQINPNVNPKEFLVQLIHQEKTHAETMQAQGSQASDVSAALLADPLIFLRKWVGEGFVGVLDTQAAWFVWDQLFLQKWNTSVMEEVCITLLLLLKHKFLEAEDYESMKQVFMDEPCKLYTLDIQKGWFHVQGKGLHSEVPYMNRQRECTPVPSPLPEIPKPEPSVASTPRNVRETPDTLQAVGIKWLKLTLIIPAEVLQKEKWTKSFKVEKVTLKSTVYFGSVQIESVTSTVTPVLKSTGSDQYGGKKYQIDYPKQKFEFANIDTTQLDLEREMGGYPYAIIQAEYQHDPQGPQLSLGWARIKLYELQEEPQRPVTGESDPNQLYTILIGELSHPLYPGTGADGVINAVSQTPVSKAPDLIGGESILGVLVYNPKNEPVTPEPTPEPPKKPET